MIAALLLVASLAGQVAGNPQAAESVIRERLARPAGNFQQEEELLSLIRYSHPPRGDREADARFAYYRLESLRRTARAASKEPVFQSYFVEILAQGNQMLSFSDMSNSWELNDSYVRQVLDEFRGTAAADDIAWLATEWGGECQDEIVCPVHVLDQYVGEYLRNFPAGKHTGDAVDRIARWLDFKGQHPFSRDPMMPKEMACRGLAHPLKSLMQAIRASNAGRKDRALAPLHQLEAACRKD